MTVLETGALQTSEICQNRDDFFKHLKNRFEAFYRHQRGVLSIADTSYEEQMISKMGKDQNSGFWVLSLLAIYLGQII